MNLKYAAEIEPYNADFTNFVERKVDCFRWVFDDITDDKNFKPPYAIDPEREKKDLSEGRAKFNGYALSFYDSIEHSIKQLDRIFSNKRRLPLKIGRNIAVGTLEYEDGVSDLPSSKGHFDHFEYENVNFESRFSIVHTISIEDNEED